MSCTGAPVAVFLAGYERSHSSRGSRAQVLLCAEPVPERVLKAEGIMEPLQPGRGASCDAMKILRKLPGADGWRLLAKEPSTAVGARGSPAAAWVPRPLSVGWIGGVPAGCPHALQWPFGVLGCGGAVAGDAALLCSRWDPAPSGSVLLAPRFLCHGDMSLQDEGSWSSPLAPALRNACVSTRLRFPL